MRNILRTASCALLICLPLAASAQTLRPTTPAPTPPSTATSSSGTLIRDGNATPKIPGGAALSPSPTGGSAQEVLNAIRGVCNLVEFDGKLFAACDNTTPTARIRGSAGYLPQQKNEWVAFAQRLVDADFGANGKRRAVVILNNADTVAVSNSAGVVKLKK